MSDFAPWVILENKIDDTSFWCRIRFNINIVLPAKQILLKYTSNLYQLLQETTKWLSILGEEFIMMSKWKYVELQSVNFLTATLIQDNNVLTSLFMICMIEE